MMEAGQRPGPGTPSDQARRDGDVAGLQAMLHLMELARAARQREDDDTEPEPDHSAGPPLPPGLGLTIEELKEDDAKSSGAAAAGHHRSDTVGSMDEELARFMRVESSFVAQRLEKLGLRLGTESVNSPQEIRQLMGNDEQFRRFMRESILEEVDQRSEEELQELHSQHQKMQHIRSTVGLAALQPFPVEYELDQATSFVSDTFSNEALMRRWSSFQREVMSMKRIFERGDPEGSTSGDTIIYCRNLQSIVRLIKAMKREDMLEDVKSLFNHQEFALERTERCADFIINTKKQFQNAHSEGLWQSLAVDSLAFKQLLHERKDNWLDVLCLSLVYISVIKTNFSGEAEHYQQGIMDLPIASLLKDGVDYNRKAQMFVRTRGDALISFFDSVVEIAEIRKDMVRSRRNYVLYALIGAFFTLVVVLNGLLFNNQFIFTG